MTESAQKILKEALGLSPAERAALIDELTSSLDRPDPDIEERWAKEAEDRLQAYRAGELEAIAEEEIVGDCRRRPGRDDVGRNPRTDSGPSPWPRYGIARATGQGIGG